MKEHKRKVLILRNGKLVIEDAPVTKGQEVEVTIRVSETPRPTFPLKGLPVTLREPFLPAVDESEWDAEK